MKYNDDAKMQSRIDLQTKTYYAENYDHPIGMLLGMVKGRVIKLSSKDDFRRIYVVRKEFQVANEGDVYPVSFSEKSKVIYELESDRFLKP